MLATSHALVGALFATQLTNPVVAVTACLISHPLLDLFPHWDFNSRWSKISKTQKFLLSAADSGIGMGLGLLLFANSQTYPFVIVCMIIAQWADFLEAPYHFGFQNIWFFKTIKSMQHWWHTKASWPWGFYPQVVIWLLAIWIRLYPILAIK